MQCKANTVGEAESLLGEHTWGSHATCCLSTSTAKLALHHCHSQAQLQPTLHSGSASAVREEKQLFGATSQLHIAKTFTVHWLDGLFLPPSLTQMLWSEPWPLLPLPLRRCMWLPCSCCPDLLCWLQNISSLGPWILMQLLVTQELSPATQTGYRNCSQRHWM